jgi:diguanylate cyclase (GGDEF)-like protein
LSKAGKFPIEEREQRGKAPPEESMKILFIGSDQETFLQLQLAWGRTSSSFTQVGSPEAAAFMILHDPVHALVCDLTDPSIAWSEWLPNLLTLSHEMEWVLIAEDSQLLGFDFQRLRGCFGILSPPVYGVRSMILLSQLSQKINLNQKLRSMEDLSVTDGLTKLFNHAYMQRQIEQELSRCQGKEDIFSVIFLDVDHFKKYNDQNGHPEGDVVLVKVAQLLTLSVRRFDLIGRYGGEEFIMLLPGAPLHVAVAIAERVRRTIQTTEFAHGKKQPMGFVSVSIGVSTWGEPGITSRAELIHHADQALYKAKENGRNQVWYYCEESYHPYRSEQISQMRVRGQQKS